MDTVCGKMRECADPNHLPPLDRVLDGLRLIAVVWLLLVGLWSGPRYGATLVYPNGLFEVEIGLAVVLIVLAARGRVGALRAYPFLWPCLGALAVSAVAAGLRLTFRHTAPADEVLALWRTGEPMARGLLLFLALAGQPRLLRIAWITVLASMAVHAGAAIVQHLTGVSRWYADLDGGWASGIMPVHDQWQRVAQGIPPRVQGLTSYINLTAALFAGSLSFWAIPLILRISKTRWGQAALLAGGVATQAGLYYTNSRGPLLAALLIPLFLLWRVTWPWRISLLLGVAGFLTLVIVHATWLTLSAVLLAALLLALMRRRHLRYLIPIAIGLGLAGGIQVVDSYVLHYQLQARVGQVADVARVRIYLDALHTIADAPWWGVGDRGVAERVVLVPKMNILPVVQRNEHNQYLHWAAAEGIPVAIAFTLLVGWAVLWCWRMAWRTPEAFPRALALATAIGLATYLASNLVDAHFWRIEGGGFFWSLIAVCAACLHLKGGHHEMAGIDVN